jgi:hypothetical protein
MSATMNPQAPFWRAVLTRLADNDRLGVEPEVLAALDDDQVVEAGQAVVTGFVEPLADVVGRFAAETVKAYQRHSA